MWWVCVWVGVCIWVGVCLERCVCTCLFVLLLYTPGECVLLELIYTPEAGQVTTSFSLLLSAVKTNGLLIKTMDVSMIFLLVKWVMFQTYFM